MSARIRIVSEQADHTTMLAYAAAVRARGHQVESLHPDDPEPDLSADLYLLKSRTPRAIRLARRAEAAGAVVCNSADATALCVDRAAMAARAREAGVPFPVTHAFAGPAALAAPGRLILKSRHCRKDEPLPAVGTAAELRAAGWPDEPVVAQAFADGDGWDHKFWAVGDRIFAGLRRPPTAHAAPAGKRTVPVPDPSAASLEVVRAVGTAFGLHVYGVDIVAAASGPLVVDINAFPGLSGLPDAADALAVLTGRLLAASPDPPGQPGRTTVAAK